jgi:hypothetical protein
MRMRIRIKCISAKLCKAIAESLEPDNLRAPPTIKVRSNAKVNVTTTSITCRGNLETFIATIDDLLLCLDAACKTLEVVESERRA